MVGWRCATFFIETDGSADKLTWRIFNHNSSKNTPGLRPVVGGQIGCLVCLGKGACPMSLGPPCCRTTVDSVFLVAVLCTTTRTDWVIKILRQ